MSLKKNLLPDLLAGLTVSFAALSLGAAFGVMSGRGAFAGMLGAAVIPIITSLFGGTRIQASGPTAPMTAITALLVAHAYESFPDRIMAEQFITLTLLISSVFIVLAGLFKLGKYITIVPQVVVLGFMNGIALLIWLDQVKVVFGLGGKEALSGGMWLNSLIAVAVLVSILSFPLLLTKFKVPISVSKFLPAIFITILGFTLFTSLSGLAVQHVELGSTVSSFSEFTNLITSYFPSDLSILSADNLKIAIPLALQLCLLAYLDSLLTSMVVDKMTKEKTKHNKELMAQGLANGVSAFLQGIPGAQATIRSVLLLKEGAKSRMSGVYVGIFTLLGFLIFSKLIVLITSAVFAGVLLKAGWDVFDRDFPVAYMKYKWAKRKTRNIQLAIVVFTTLVTVFVNLNVAVIAGTILFYVGKKFWGFVDCEADFSEVHSTELLGENLDEKEYIFKEKN